MAKKTVQIEEVSFEEESTPSSPMARLMSKTKFKDVIKAKGKNVTSKVVKFRSKEEMRAIVEAVRDEINKEFKDEVLIFGSDVKFMSYGKLPINNFALDVASGGGIFIGGIISVSGAYSTGKTLNALHFVAECQCRGLICVWIALEPFDAEWAELQGVDTSLLLVLEPSGAEEALQVAIDCQWREDVDAVVIDSVEALESTKSRDNEFGESIQMGIKQKLIGEYLRKFRAINNFRKRRSRKNSDIRPLTLFLINQLREKPTMFGDPEYEPGGRALGFYSDIMLRLREGTPIYYSKKQGVVYDKKPNDGVEIGRSIKYKVHKNKTFRRAQTGEYDMFFDKGGPVPPGHFDNVKAAIMEGLAWNVIKAKSQGVYVLADTTIRGKEALVKAMRDKPELIDKVRDEIIYKMETTKSNVGENDDQEE